ncbi:MAG: hypothetical protein MSA07_06465 [Mucispirillum sp.]|nr:hypothetical protein [Mucispirillum sp.]
MTAQNKMYAVKKAYFPFNLILWIFKKTMCKPNSKVAMIDPIFLNILTIGDNKLIPATLYKHEQAHIEQVKKHGRLKFIVKYLFYNIKYGYKNNPYEVEARKYE